MHTSNLKRILKNANFIFTNSRIPNFWETVCEIFLSTFLREKMRSILKKLQTAQAGKPYHGFTKLAIRDHQISRFRMTKNKFAKDSDGSKTMIVELSSEILFVPQYFSGNLTENDIDELNSSIRSGTENMYLYFGGHRENST